MQETNHLKNAHYEAMRGRGLTDDEIDADWKQFMIDYEKLLDDLSGDLGAPREDLEREYRPFGGTVIPKKIEKKEDLVEEFPWYE